jgi:predicted HAD superfamily Cof-like phosphohydrolase
MRLAGQALPALPVLPSLETRKLRANLIMEEALETIKGLGFAVVIKPQSNGWDIQEANAPDLVEIVDGCADISVVTMGTLLACGIGDEELLKLVDENNLAKFGPGGHRREDGKWVKPPGHQPPDIKGLLDKGKAQP